mgnify:CR=1 FL=1
MLPASYDDSRARFRGRLAELQARWPTARLHSHALRDDPELTIDWIVAEPRERPAKLLMLTTGLHGAEGHVGAAMLELFVETFAPQLDPAEVGLLLVHAINPWGMRHGRRVNAANVDLNRNWRLDVTEPAPAAPDYAALNDFLNPRGPIERLGVTRLGFFAGLLRRLIGAGTGRIKAATLMGQYDFPEGIYYGGVELQEESRVLLGLYEEHLDRYAAGRVVHIDIHTGYGPRDQMSIVNSALDPRDPAELRRRVDYPLILRANPAEFYAIHGDMLDSVNALVQQRGLTERVYATTFEFGTVGDSLPALIHSLITMVLENRLWRFGGSDAARAVIGRDFRELFAPSDPAWLVKAQADANRALGGILRAEGF